MTRRVLTAFRITAVIVSRGFRVAAGFRIIVEWCCGGRGWVVVVAAVGVLRHGVFAGHYVFID